MLWQSVLVCFLNLLIFSCTVYTADIIINEGQNFDQFQLKGFDHVQSSDVTGSLRKHLALDVFKSAPNINMVVSVLPITLALCHLASVANGEAKEELMKALGIGSLNSLKNCFNPGLEEMMTQIREHDLILLNKIYVNYTDTINPNFLTNSTKNVGVRVDQVGFDYPNAAVEFVNRWVEKATLKRIPGMLTQEDINKNTTMIILSAAYFKCAWETPFDLKQTEPGKFYHYVGRVSMVPMMTKVDECYYYEDPNHRFKLVKLKLVNFGSSMTIVVPKRKTGLNNLLTMLYKNPELLINAQKDMKWTLVKIQLPRFHIKSTVDLEDFLKEMGINTIFDKTSSGLEDVLKKSVKDKKIALDLINQSVFIDVDETGVFTNRPDARQGLDLPPPESPMSHLQELIADRPFYFRVDLGFHEAPSELFSGVYNGPIPEFIVQGIITNTSSPITESPLSGESGD